ncbi:hypothetical protein AA0473_0517 [Acetobacter orleanensis NRIC 0473]|uniref:Uncharacterized protein n=1 Tax=Acetobacter orleanensis TaxID=104099 RepID=A0A4Y3TQM3_9PROT|nr:hypothetical protein Abol_011_004 [Acetobacter orleanensis JCM 7639]GBR23965.1 hypothetical protein AA0473_0517 [Acetobacter orleanensis NRIC 0473]GEB83085.1 hypothetical protein AOR01nite_15620 [Acetobacter orleanensis]
MRDSFGLLKRAALVVVGAIGVESPAFAGSAVIIDHRISVTSEGKGNDILLIP